MKKNGFGCLGVLALVLVFVGLIALYGYVSGMPTVVDVKPDQIPTVPVDGVKLFLELLGF